MKKGGLSSAGAGGAAGSSGFGFYDSEHEAFGSWAEDSAAWEAAGEPDWGAWDCKGGGAGPAWPQGAWPKPG